MLENGGHIRSGNEISRRIGFLLRDGALESGAVVSHIPAADFADAEQSVCGLKAFLIDERREFTDETGDQKVVDCAKVAALDITDSPVHVHGETVETYHIIAGSGRMLLGEKIVKVQAGSFIVIPPGTPHGLTADDPTKPLRVVMTFSPGLAPIQHQDCRDEKILAESAAAVIASA